MALVNVAAELVRRGRRVLVIDFDLEAPGLETYKHLHPPKPHPGIVEYVTEYRRTNAVPNLLDYLYETKPIGKKGGHLWVMPAGRRDKAYRKALVDLDWQRLYGDEQGFLLFEDTKEGWRQELNPDYILIDSRTGDTDVLGICTRQLADSVVLMFPPNEQNLAGLENVCRDIRKEETEGLKKKIRLHFVAANVPDLDDEKRILRRQLDAFRKRLDFKYLSGEIKRYENLYLLDQSVFVLDRPHTRLARSYRRLVRTLLKDNLADREGALTFLRGYAKEPNTLPWLRLHGTSWDSIQEGEKLPINHGSMGILIWEKNNGQIKVHDMRSGGVSFRENTKRLHEIAGHFKYDAEILMQVAGCFILDEDFLNAAEMYDRALQAKPACAEALYRGAACKINLGQIDKAADYLVARLCLPEEDGQSYGFSHLKTIQRLRAIAPLRLIDVADRLEEQDFKGLSPMVPQPAFASFLCDTEKGVNRAASLLGKYLGRLEKGEKIPEFVVLSLLRARCWTKIIELHEAGRLEDYGPHAVLDRALAHWGKDGEMPESLCRQAMEELELRDPGLRISRSGLDHKGLMLWRLGRIGEAIDCLEREEKKTVEYFADEDYLIFSLWRLQEVSKSQFLDDCRLWRRLFQGEPLRPAFLGPPAD